MLYVLTRDSDLCMEVQHSYPDILYVTITFVDFISDLKVETSYASIHYFPSHSYQVSLRKLKHLNLFVLFIAYSMHSFMECLLLRSSIIIDTNNYYF